MKKKVMVMLDTELHAEAKEKHLNVSKECNNGLKLGVERDDCKQKEE